MNIKQLNEKLQKFLEGYPDFDFADSEYQIDCNENSEWDPAYHMIEVDGKYAIFAAWFTGGDYETDRRSKWFSSEEEALDYYHKELSMEPYDDGNYDDPDEDDWLADDLDESQKRKLKENEQNTDKQQLIALARKYGDNITLKDILAKIRNVDERLSDQARKSTSKFMKRIEKVDRNKKEK